MANERRGTDMKKATRTQRFNREPEGKGKPARGKRDDTFEAREQNRRSPKTHPTGAIGGRRKDKNTGGGAPSAEGKAPKIKAPTVKRRGRAR